MLCSPARKMITLAGSVCQMLIAMIDGIASVGSPTHRCGGIPRAPSAVLSSPTTAQRRSVGHRHHMRAVRDLHCRCVRIAVNRDDFDAEALQLNAIAVYGKQATGEKYLINPNKGLL